MNQKAGDFDHRVDSASADHRRFPCVQCGASLEYAPGVDALQCAYCGQKNYIVNAGIAIEEQDFRAALGTQASNTPTRDSVALHCASCGASYSFDTSVYAGECPFCGAPTVANTGQYRELQIQALLPFKIPREQAQQAFRLWLGKLWFAPNKLKNYARDEGRLAGIYVPYWTYDARTATTYQGERGDTYQVQENYRAVENGREVLKTRVVTRIRWTPAAGQVSRFFDDVLVLASRSLPRAVTERLEPWDLDNLKPYQEDYLSGFRSEMYQINLEQGFEHAREIMAPTIYHDIRNDIGGDHQRIHMSDTRYSEVSFKHILLPVWMSAFRFKSRSYRFVVNGRTGEVQGERPYSRWKIAVAVLLALLLAGGGLALLRYAETHGDMPTKSFRIQ